VAVTVWIGVRGQVSAIYAVWLLLHNDTLSSPEARFSKIQATITFVNRDCLTRISGDGMMIVCIFAE